MFTGLVAEVGRVAAVDQAAEGARLAIETTLAGGFGSGDSIAVDGACLTATATGPGEFRADVMNQTLELTSLGALVPGDPVNLELALRAGDPLGGHLVQGHVDAVAELAEVREDGFARWLRIALPGDLGRYAVERGSIALAGVSLTVARVEGNQIEVSLIPETQQRTTLGGLVAGARINVEIDLFARYAERLLQPFGGRDGS